MSWVQNRKSRNPEKPIPGCLGRMVDLFDFNTGVRANKLLTEKPHHDGSPFSRRQSDVTRMSLVDDQMDDKECVQIVSDSRKSNGTPIKMLIAQEMLKEEDGKQSPSNLVAKLMGLDAQPHQHELGSASHKDVYEIRENDSSQKLALVREKFMEAKRLSTDDTLRQSKQFHDALDVLSSNRDSFLKFLQEPNSLFSQNLYDLQSVPPPPDSRRITILKPSKSVDNEKHVCNANGSDISFSPECCKTVDKPTHPTRIVVLTPSSLKAHNVKVVSSSTSHDETLISSVLSNGYIGDDSSYCKSEIENVSESKGVSPASRHSWDYINRFNSQYTASSSRTSYYPESSVCREAKKRLSERFAMMSSHKNVPEQREIHRNSSTLGDMLALTDLKKSVKPDENDEVKSSRNLSRSKSVPARLGVEVSVSLNGKVGDTKDVVKEKLVKSSSFKGRVSSLFFTKSKKASKEKSHQPNDVSQCSGFSPKHVGSERSQCASDSVIEDASCSVLRKSISLPEVGFSFTKSEFSGNHIENQDQPSPISVLEPQFEEDEQRTNCHHNIKPHQHGIEQTKYNLIDKSPPIGSISRTLSWDDSVGSSTRHSGKPSSTPLNPDEEEQECLFYVQTLLSVAGLDKIRSNSFLSKWHSPESPLDPSLRSKYMNLSEKEPIISQTKLTHHRAITKLVFDCVNEVLMDIASRGPYTGAHSGLDDMVMSSMVLVDRVWGQMKGWLSQEESCDMEEVDGGSVVVEREVMRAVVGRGWVEGLRIEIDNTRKEIERKLLEELVQESVWEMIARSC